MRSITQPTGRLRIVAVLALVALSPVARAGTPAPHPKPQPLVVKVNDDGFHWGDAGIGAAAGFGAALVLSGSLALAAKTGRVTNSSSETEERL